MSHPTATGPIFTHYTATGNRVDRNSDYITSLHGVDIIRLRPGSAFANQIRLVGRDFSGSGGVSHGAYRSAGRMLCNHTPEQRTEIIKLCRTLEALIL